MSVSRRSDIRASAILKFAVYLLFATIAVLFLMQLSLRRLRAVRGEAAAAAPDHADSARRQPPLPRLQELPTQDLAELRDGENAALSSYGWVDPPSGIVRIPIEEAMRLVPSAACRRAVPRRPQPAAPKTGGKRK